MRPKAIDANILLRFVVADHPVMSPKCRELLARVERGEETVFLPEAALQDVIWTLKSHYRWPRERIRAFADQLLALDHLTMRDKARFWSALDLFEDRRIDFSDALIVAETRQEGLDAIYSYDRDFDRVASLDRIEP